MVSTTITPTSKVPQLSYAERAKKAQNIKSPISAPPPSRVANQSFAAAPNASATSTTLSSSTAPSSVIRSASSTSTDDAPNSSVLHGTQPSSPIQSPVVTSNGEKGPANDEPLSPTELAVKALSIVAAHTSPQKTPVLNFWNRRKEQMAAFRSSPQNNPSSGGVPSTQKQSILPSTTQDSTKNHPVGAGLKDSQNVMAETPFKPLSSLPTEAYDPFIVRSASKPGHVLNTSSVPPVIDVETWPEVGKPALPTSSDHNANSSSTSTHQAVSKIAKDQDAVSDIHQQPTGGQKKGEKAKWIPIPPGELQAAADAAALQSSRPHPRKTSRAAQKPGNGQGQSSTFMSDQPHKRTSSGKNSASHSRVQSRSESLQSSPRLPRGRRLPGDEKRSPKQTEIHLQNSNGLPPRSSGENSPQLQISSSSSSQSMPASADASGNRGSDVYPSLTSGSNVPPLVYGFHPSLPPPHLPISIPIQNPSQFSHTSYSPASASRTGSPSLQNLPMPPAPYPGVVPPLYPMYPTAFGTPFEYSASTSIPPPLYWNGPILPQNRSGQHSPAYPPAVPQRPVVLTTNASPFYPDPDRHTAFVNGHPASEDRQQPVAQFISQEVRENDEENSRTKSDKNGKQGVRNEKPVIFGTIGLPTSPSSPIPEPVVILKESAQYSGEIVETPYTQFSIGVLPDEQRPRRLRSRTNSSKTLDRTRTVSDSALSMQAGLPQEIFDLPKETKSEAVVLEPEGSRWEFGTTGFLAPTSMYEPPTANGAQLSPMSGSASPTQLPLDPIIPPTPPSPGIEGSRPGNDEEFQVKDYGFGFGTASGSGNAVALVREEMLAREREWEEEKLVRQQRARQQEQAPIPIIEIPEEDINTHYAPNGNGRSKRVPTGNFVPDRSIHSGRRGRGPTGYSRGISTRPHHVRGGFNAPPYLPRPIHPPNINSALPFQPIIPFNESPTGYFPPPRQQLATYIPPFEPYMQLSAIPAPQAAQAAPPPPPPLTTLTFPLDSTRYYLLGQLEYYLSPQNMARDVFLRQRMDSQGWIHIPLIASFNRVRQMTVDANLVRDVLRLSSMVEVRDNWVRMGGWERFVYPDATPSVFDGEAQNFSDNSALWGDRSVEPYYPYDVADNQHEPRSSFEVRDERATVTRDNDKNPRHGTEDPVGFDDDIEEEDDDVVFVMEKESGI